MPEPTPQADVILLQLNMAEASLVLAQLVFTKQLQENAPDRVLEFTGALISLGADNLTLPGILTLRERLQRLVKGAGWVSQSKVPT